MTYRTKADAIGVLDLRHIGQSIHHYGLPAGLRCSPTGDGQFFLDDYRGVVGEGQHHDAEYRGVRIDPQHVDEA